MPYIGTSPSNGVRRVHTYTATASQTTFSGASSEGVTLSYADTNYLDVFQNGVLLGSADYTSTSGTSVVLAQGASADDLIVIVVYDVFSVADTVSKTNGGTFDGAVTFGGGVSGVLDADGGITVDNITIDGTEIDLSSGDLTIDVAGDIILDADGGDLIFKDGGTQIGRIRNASSGEFTFNADVQDKDIVFNGNDGGSTVTAGFFDMSDGGTFRTGSQGSANPGSGSNGVIIVNGEGGILITGGSSALRIYSTSSGVPTAQISASGALSKTSGSFKINHPLESKKDTHYLVHSFIEGPKADLIYRGKVTLSSGTATINIDTVSGMTEGTFEALNTDVQCFTSNESGWTAIKGSVSGNTLTITAQDNSCKDTISWMVIGERNDPHMKDSGTDWTDSDGKVILEPEKESE